MTAFIKKYREHITLQMPESTYFTQSANFIKFNVQQFFNNTKAVNEKHDALPTHRIHSVSETGLSSVLCATTNFGPKRH